MWRVSFHSHARVSIALFTLAHAYFTSHPPTHPFSYFCLSRLLDGVQDNFTFAQKGIQRKVFALKRLTRKILPELCDHLDKLNIDFLHFGFRWMNCLLMRELNLECVLRLWDACVSRPYITTGFRP
jgi:hypothetical protein